MLSEIEGLIIENNLNEPKIKSNTREYSTQEQPIIFLVVKLFILEKIQITQALEGIIVENYTEVVQLSPWKNLKITIQIKTLKKEQFLKTIRIVQEKTKTYLK